MVFPLAFQQLSSFDWSCSSKYWLKSHVNKCGVYDGETYVTHFALISFILTYRCFSFSITIRLKCEVQQIKDSIIKLREQLCRAQDVLQELLRLRSAKETELAIKNNSLFIDREKVLGLRTNWPGGPVEIAAHATICPNFPTGTTGGSRNLCMCWSSCLGGMRHQCWCNSFHALKLDD